MHDNAPSHSAQKTNEYLNKIGLRDIRFDEVAGRFDRPECDRKFVEPLEGEGLH